MTVDMCLTINNKTLLCENNISAPQHAWGCNFERKQGNGSERSLGPEGCIEGLKRPNNGQTGLYSPLWGENVVYIQGWLANEQMHVTFRNTRRPVCLLDTGCFIDDSNESCYFLKALIKLNYLDELSQSISILEI